MRIFLLLLAMFFIASFPFISNWLPNKKMTNVNYDQNRIYEIIDEYVKEHPDRIFSSVLEYNNKKTEQDRLAAEKAHKADFAVAMQKNIDDINNTDYPSFGKGNSVRVVEFFDYNCGYCKRMKDITDEIINNQDVYYTFREMAFLRASSAIAAKAAISVYLLDHSKYLAFNKTLLEYNGEYTEASITKIVTDLNIDVEQFEKMQKSEKVEKMLQNSSKLFHSLGIGGTPAFIIGDELVTGAIDIDTFKEKIQQALSNTKQVDNHQEKKHNCKSGQKANPNIGINSTEEKTSCDD